MKPTAIKPAATGRERLSVAYSLTMKKHSATLFLAVLVALGAGQGVPLSVFQGRHVASAIEQVVKSRRNQRVRRSTAPHVYSTKQPRISYHNDLPLLPCNSCNAHLLRAPPFPSFA
jgi:hypothetical protein